MDKAEMPANISYTLLVHAGSYKDFTKKIAQNFEGLDIKCVKQKAIHYYIVQITENGKAEYKKEEIYKLPIMAMKEEFSNYLFFKSIKAYNNVLKIMCDGNHNDNAPYDLYMDMLTGLEKLKLSDVNKDTKVLSFTKKEHDDEVHTMVYGANIFSASTLNNIFEVIKFKVDDKEIDLTELLKKQKLTIGVI